MKKPRNISNLHSKVDLVQKADIKPNRQSVLNIRYPSHNPKQQNQKTSKENYLLGNPTWRMMPSQHDGTRPKSIMWVRRARSTSTSGTQGVSISTRLHHLLESSDRLHFRNSRWRKYKIAPSRGWRNRGDDEHIQIEAGCILVWTDLSNLFIDIWSINRLHNHLFIAARVFSPRPRK